MLMQHQQAKIHIENILMFSKSHLRGDVVCVCDSHCARGYVVHRVARDGTCIEYTNLRPANGHTSIEHHL